MKMITYAAAFVILATTVACEKQSNQGAAPANTAPQQNVGAGPPPPGGVPTSTIRQLRENVLTNQ
jgi:hypothetical protein